MSLDAKDILRSLLPEGTEVSDEKLDVLLLRAENTILDYIGRDTLPDRLLDLKAELALIMFNRLGADGEVKRSEGEIDMTFIDGLPSDFLGRLKNYPRRVGALNAVN